VIIATKQAAQTKRRSGQDSRGQLLEVAALQFARKGLHRVTMADIAAEAGMSGPALYNHFKSKNALFIEVVCLMYDEEIAAFADVLDPLDSVSNAIDALLDKVPQMYRDDGVLQMLGLSAQLEAVRDPESFGPILEAARRRDEVAVRLVRRAQERGELPPDADAEEWGALLISLFVGALGNRSLRASQHRQFIQSAATLRQMLHLMQPRAAGAENL
jgi:AcrR family transcriptional regulator